MSRFLSAPLQAMAAYVPGEQPRDMAYIKLNTNEAPYPPAPSVCDAIGKTDVELLRLYSDPTAKALKGKLAALYGVEPENIFLSNGSDETLNFAFMAFGQGGVAFPDISYGFYKVYGELYGLNCLEIPLKDDFSLDFQDYCGISRMVVIANPNAPTGLSIPVAQVEEILRSNPDNVVLIDEAYVDFGGESCCKLLDQYENLLVVRTFSKSRCLAGGRLGYAIGPKGLIDDLEKIKFSTNPYNLDRLTLTLGEATVDAEPYYRDMCRRIIQVRSWTAEELKKLGFQVLPSDANFLFAKTDKMAGGELYQELKARGILVRHFSAPRIREYLRITIGTQEQMETFVEKLKEILEWRSL
jgi:histidinol-phosphate aminotransferase